MKHIQTLALICLAGLMLSGCGQPGAPVSTPVNIDISVRVEPQPLAVGATMLIVTLKDASGSPVDGASLKVQGNMDHAGMMPVNAECSESSDGEYRVPFEWTMGGGWVVTVTAHFPDGSEVSQNFDYFVEAVSGKSIINHGGSTSDMTARIDFQPDRNPAHAGNATVTIRLTDASGSPITDALVEVIADMGHHGMLPVSGTGEHQAEGDYLVALRWTMAGDWLVKVHVTLSDGTTLEKTFEQPVILSAGG